MHGSYVVVPELSSNIEYWQKIIKLDFSYEILVLETNSR